MFSLPDLLRHVNPTGYKLGQNAFINPTLGNVRNYSNNKVQ